MSKLLSRHFLGSCCEASTTQNVCTPGNADAGIETPIAQFFVRNYCLFMNATAELVF